MNRRTLLIGTGMALAVGATLSSCMQEDKNMNAMIVELVTFKLMGGIEDSAFLKAAQASNVFIKKQKGFIARRLSKNETGVWTDHVEWATLEDAQAAADKFMGEETLRLFMMAIDPNSISMSHNTLMVST